jgi:4-methyl-5(b-hydroxyethyl)-thiazole monophosphate biosynthesis
MVYVLLGTGFEETEAIAPIDLMRRANIPVLTVGLNGKNITGGHGITVKADITVKEMDLTQMEMIVLPGGLGGVASILGCKEALDAITFAYENNKLIGAICAAPTVLVEAGALRPGVHVTCYPTCQMELDRAWSPAPVVADGGVITGQAPGSALLFALVVLQHLAGESVAQRIARAMVTDVLS